MQAARDALDGVPTDAPTDALLDFYNGLAKAVHGRLDGADTMARVNDALKDMFDRFDLLTTEAGVLIRPVLNAAAAERIMGDAVERIGSGSWADGFAMGHQHPDGIEPIPLLARESEPIVPPLRSITADPDGNVPYARNTS